MLRAHVASRSHGPSEKVENELIISKKKTKDFRLSADFEKQKRNVKKLRFTHKGQTRNNAISPNGDENRLAFEFEC